MPGFVACCAVSDRRRSGWQGTHSRLQLTHRNMKRKMLVVGPLVAADSESILRTFRIVGAMCAASAGSSESSGLTPARFGRRSTSLPLAAAAVGDHDAPPGLRHRRIAPELA
jgi:hypothetical protein